MTALLVVTAGGMGAVCRYLLSRLADRGGSGRGTTIVNLAGAGAAGLLAGVSLAGGIHAVAVTGFLGGFTTFSTWILESLVESPVPRPWERLAAATVLGWLAVGAGLAVAGLL